MPRPLRVEIENGFYHVMNRGRGRQTVFHDADYYHAFLDVLSQSHDRFGVVVHTYCLMGNHYHLLLQTPQANLSRIMLHINGLFTQQYNRLKRTDGPLFRGRYKSIIVDADAYLLQVSRYIHRNPVATKKPLVTRLEDYPWSSYPVFIGKQKSPRWLERELTYRALGKRQKQVGYRAFVEAGVDEEIAEFYSKGNMSAVLGDKVFREKLIEEQDRVQRAVKTNKAISLQVYGKPTIDKVVNAVAAEFKVDRETIVQRQAGRQHKNGPRKLAMYLCQSRGYRLGELVEAFGVGHVGTVSNAIAWVKREQNVDRLFRERVEKLSKRI